MARRRCHLTAIVGWVALTLGVGLVLVHFYIVGIPSGGPSPVEYAEALHRGGGLPPQTKSSADQALGGIAGLDAAMHAVQPRAPPTQQEFANNDSAEVLPLEEWKLSDDNNAKFPGPRPGDSFERSSAPDVLPGASSSHMHGILGRDLDGQERIQPTPLPPGGLSREEREDAHRGFCFNSRVSDSLSLDRVQSDQRSPACKRKHVDYRKDLAMASVVIVFHNENFSVLVRSILSVLNHSPPHLLKEIIVVDDASVPVDDRFYEKHWKRLQGELRDYLMTLPKLALLRCKERRGLMVARMEGIWRATAEVTVFLDSHIEATPGYLEPLLARVKETDGRSVVVPRIDTIGTEDFVYGVGGGLGVLGFSWTLGQMPESADTGGDGTRISHSPVMAGGLLAASTRGFLRLGGYDPEMRLYGGEEMEIGFRTWMCGGAIEYVPCSHIGHVFRTPEFWKGQVYAVPGEEISRNKLRTAAVWMDGYAKLVEYAASPLPETLPMGDLRARQALRSKLHCKDFAWYLRHVVPDMFAPKVADDAKGGCLVNKVQDACIDTLGQSGDGMEIGVYPCHYQHGTQALVMDSDGLVRLPQTGYKECMALLGSDKVVQATCKKTPDHLWSWDAVTGHFTSRSTNGCLSFVDKPSAWSSFSLVVEACAAGPVREQTWEWHA